MKLTNNTKNDFIFKKINGRRFTTTDKTWYEEHPGSLFKVHSTDIWVDKIPEDAPFASTGAIQYFADLKLTRDNSTANNKAWLACSTYNNTDTQLRDFIPPRFGQGYTVRLFQDDGNGGKGDEIPTTHPSNWLFDYENGVLIFENDPTSYGLTPPFHISVHKYVGNNLTGLNATPNKLRAFIFEAEHVNNIPHNQATIDITDKMDGKIPGGSETTTGVVVDYPNNISHILSYPDKDEIYDSNGNKVYGRITYNENDNTWHLSFKVRNEDGSESDWSYNGSEPLNIIFTYNEVREFSDWPVFDASLAIQSNQVATDIPYATTKQAGKVRLAGRAEEGTDAVITSGDQRAIKTNEFGLVMVDTAHHDHIEFSIKGGVYNSNGDTVADITLNVNKVPNNYYLIYINTISGTIEYINDKTPPSVPNNCVALYRFSTNEEGQIEDDIQDVRSIYILGADGGGVLLGKPDDGSYDDGLLSFTPSTKINNAIDSVNEVLKYLAPEDAKPLANNLVINNITTTGYVADGIALTNVNAGDSVVAFRETTLSGSTPDTNERFNKADQGTLKLIKDDNELDVFDLAAHFNENERAGAQSYTPASGSNNKLTITSVEWYNNFPLWQKGNATFNINGLTVGDLKIKMVHDINNDGKTIHETNEMLLFCDPETARPGIVSGPTVKWEVQNFKYLSGIKFIGKDSQAKISLTTDDKVFEYTYVNTPVRLTYPGAIPVDVAYNDATVTGVSNIPKYNESMVITDKTVTLDVAGVTSDAAKAGAIVRDPWGTGATATEAITDKVLVNTYPQYGTSTGLEELFQDEYYRLQPDYNFEDNTTDNPIVGNWNSESVLSNGNAQVFNGRLIYPQTNFTLGHQPAQNFNTDYSKFTGDQVYYRSFYKEGTPHNSGTVALGGITWNDVISGKVKVEIKLPGQTGWLDLSKDYNSATFMGTDGEGAMTGHTEANGRLYIDWSSGTFSTANSKFRYFIRITLTETGKDLEINYLAEAGW